MARVLQTVGQWQLICDPSLDRHYYARGNFTQWNVPEPFLLVDEVACGISHLMPAQCQTPAFQNSDTTESASSAAETAKSTDTWCMSIAEIEVASQHSTMQGSELSSHEAKSGETNLKTSQILDDNNQVNANVTTTFAAIPANSSIESQNNNPNSDTTFPSTSTPIQDKHEVETENVQPSSRVKDMATRFAHSSSSLPQKPLHTRPLVASEPKMISTSSPSTLTPSTSTSSTPSAVVLTIHATDATASSSSTTAFPSTSVPQVSSTPHPAASFIDNQSDISAPSFLADQNRVKSLRYAFDNAAAMATPSNPPPRPRTISGSFGSTSAPSHTPLTEPNFDQSVASSTNNSSPQSAVTSKSPSDLESIVLRPVGNHGSVFALKHALEAQGPKLFKPLEPGTIPAASLPSALTPSTTNSQTQSIPTAVQVTSTAVSAVSPASASTTVPTTTEATSATALSTVQPIPVDSNPDQKSNVQNLASSLESQIRFPSQRFPSLSEPSSVVFALHNQNRVTLPSIPLHSFATSSAPPLASNPHSSTPPVNSARAETGRFDTARTEGQDVVTTKDLENFLFKGAQENSLQFNLFREAVVRVEKANTQQMQTKIDQPALFSHPQRRTALSTSFQLPSLAEASNVVLRPIAQIKKETIPTTNTNLHADNDGDDGDDGDDASELPLTDVGSLPAVITQALRRCSDTRSLSVMSQSQIMEKLWQHRESMKGVMDQLVAEYSVHHPNEPLPQALQRTIRVMLPPDTAPLLEDSQLVFDERTGDVKAGTLRALVERLTSDETADTNFKFDFLLTYRSFTNGRALVELLIERFRSAPMEADGAKYSPIHLRVVNVLKYWVETYFHDFEEDEELLAVVIAFTRFHLEANDTMVGLAPLLTRPIMRKLDGREKAFVSVEVTNKPKPILKEKRMLSLIKMVKPTDVLRHDPREIARQLSLLSSRVFRDIKPKELVNLNWSKKGGPSKAPNVFTMIQRCNMLCRWGQHRILSIEDAKQRGHVTTTLARIAFECMQLQNYNDAKAILGCLYSAPVFRLERTKALIRESTHMRDLDEMFGGNNWATMRIKLATLEPPCVPFLGMFLSDLTFVEDGNKDLVKDNAHMINFDKRRKIARVIQQIQQLQQNKYALTDVKELQDELMGLEVDVTDDELYNLSLAHEPRRQTATSS